MEGPGEMRRRAHEQLDRLEAAMVDLLLSDAHAATHSVPQRSAPFRRKLLIEHQLAALLDQMHQTALSLRADAGAGVGAGGGVGACADTSAGTCADTSADTGASAGAGTTTGPHTHTTTGTDTGPHSHTGSDTQKPHDLAPFYEQLRAVRNAHKLRPGEPATDPIDMPSVLARAAITSDTLQARFSGDERCGRFLDLHTHHEAFLNLLAPQEAASLDYLQYLDRVFDGARALLPNGADTKAPYLAYLTGLVAYLTDFVRRALPLVDLARVDAPAPEAEPADAIWCGPCQHAFASRAVYDAHLTGRKHRRALEHPAPPSTLEDSHAHAQAHAHASSRRRAICTKEAELLALGELLGATCRATRAFVEMRQAMTPEERAEFDADEDADADADADADQPRGTQDTASTDTGSHADANALDGRIYNPLKLPLDWDGKPIPYWLWKLHGLGVSYACEVCGNYVYMGRRAFDQHFYEWRHAHGMKCLGIPNTRHFFQVTRIDDVRRLWDRLRATAREDVFRPEAMEECEDAHGNVYDRRTYEDLKRQGLI